MSGVSTKTLILGYKKIDSEKKLRMNMIFSAIQNKIFEKKNKPIYTHA